MTVNNSIALASKYLPILDEVYKKESLTARLDATGNKVSFLGGNAVKLFKTNMDGLGDYTRNSGYTSGDVTATWETLTLSKDRGRAFMVDAMDNEETAGLAFGTLSGEFIRTQVVPELDAYRFAKYAASTTPVKANISSSTNVAALIDDAEAKMNEDEVPVEGRILYISETAYKQLKGNITRTLANEGNVSRMIETFDGMEVIRVPQARFNTAVTLKDGKSSGQEAGGFAPTAGGFKINFMIIHPSAIVQVAKHVKPRIFSPEQNIDADAWKFDYRIYHDCFVEENKTAGIYVHCASTANS